MPKIFSEFEKEIFSEEFIAEAGKSYIETKMKAQQAPTSKVIEGICDYCWYQNKSAPKVKIRKVDNVYICKPCWNILYTKEKENE